VRDDHHIDMVLPLFARDFKAIKCLNNIVWLKLFISSIYLSKKISDESSIFFFVLNLLEKHMILRKIVA
jgi:hypothetical protein